MCGILGTINRQSLRREVYKNLMIHRGPDRQEHEKMDNLDFYHYRLAIQDLTEGGKQPMFHEEFTLMFNGEIYNHSELRTQYQLKCSSTSDTETLLKLFEKLGLKMLNVIDGMFAMAIYDRKKKKLYLARDRAGKKPVYYYKKGNELSFASELNTLIKLHPTTLNYDSLNEYFFTGLFFEKHTPYNEIKEVKNGCVLEINTQTLNVIEKQWWNIQDFYKNKIEINYNEAKLKVKELLDISIKRRLEASDLEVGTFLSGGIDSGLITAFASKYKNNLKTFTVAFDGTYNEASLAKLVADKFNTDHTQIEINFSNLKNDFEKIVSNYGEPYMDSSAIPSYYVSKESKKHLTVILNGDGADELFGGYRRYVPFSKIDFFNSSKFNKNLSNALLKVLPLAHNKQSKYNYLYRLFEFSSKTDIEIYLAATSNVFVGHENYFSNKPIYEDMKARFKEINSTLNNGLDKIMCMDFQTILFADLLVKIDIATMAHSLEGRSPFLSKELLEFAPTLPTPYKIKGIKTKYILRDIAKDILPLEIHSQPKRGFEIPLKNWLDNELKSISMDYLLSSNAYCFNFIEKKFINNLINNKVKISKEKRAKLLYNLLCFEVWHKNYNEINNKLID